MTTVTPTGQVVPTATGRDLVLERTLPGSIDDAWASITEPDRLARWFCTWTGEPQVGATLKRPWSPRRASRRPPRRSWRASRPPTWPSAPRTRPAPGGSRPP